MNSRTTADFWQAFYRLPQFVQARAVIAYRKWQRNPHQRGLFFKQIKGGYPPVYSVRIGRGWRALGYKTDGTTIIWFWIGSHSDYDRILSGY